MKQENLIPEEDNLDTPTIEKKFYCRSHPWIKEEHLIEVAHPKSGLVSKKCIFCQRIYLENRKIRRTDWEWEKNNLTDYYIRRTFVAGNKLSLPMEEYPQEMIETKRAILQIQRETKKQNEPIKKCHEHGKLYLEDVIKSGITKAGTQQYQCRKCKHEVQKKHYQINKLRISLKHKEYRESNPEKIKEIKRKSREKHLVDERTKSRERWEKYNKERPEMAKERNRRYKRKAVKELNDVYVKKILMKDTFLRSSDFSKNLIELQRSITLLKRSIKQIRVKNNITEMENKTNVED